MALGATWSLSSCASRLAGAASDRKAWIAAAAVDDAAPEIMRVNALPGMALAVIDDGVVASVHAHGLASVATGAPVTDASMFEAASLSKPVFAYAVMKLAELERIDLDAPLADTLYPDDFPDHPWLRQVTARHVLAHGSGLPNWRGPVGGDLTPQFPPETRWRYSGEAFFWLQRVVETRLGEGLDALMQRLVLRPAGMRRSTFAWTPLRARYQVDGHDIDESTGVARVAPLQLRRELGKRYEAVAARWGKPVTDWTYDDVRSALAEMRPHDNPQVAALDLATLRLPGNTFPNAAGSLACTVEDYAKFVCLMFRTPRPDAWRLSESSRSAMLETAIDKDAPTLSGGLGWGLEDTQDGRWFYHEGNNGGIFRSFVLGDAERRRGLVIFTNGARGNYAVQALVELLTGQTLVSATV
ncbi:serine hydrolase domain-containing protein [Luteimonas saliphila]|uniref:serine hydrolase domain-containing protein n=1 Tax=Luteimonas saliphila TaxID=2804919 RepID=UPI00192DFE46|nr:serine hydrolase domain-containing protein [Luteimonas saliphila]